MRYLKVFALVVLASLSVSGVAQAWTTRAWLAQALMDAATLVVVAKPISAKVIAAKSILPNVTSGLAADPHIYVDDVATTFQVLAVAKGAVRGGTLVLHHQRYTNGRGPIVAGPGLIDFEPGSGHRYLMFLKVEPTGYYVAVSGLLDSSSGIVRVD